VRTVIDGHCASQLHHRPFEAQYDTALGPPVNPTQNQR
jgi:hypothetical protein